MAARWNLTVARLARFVGVGSLGLVLSSALLAALHYGWRWPVVVASAVATEIAVIHNYVLNERFTFGSRPTLSRLLRFNAVSLGGVAITVITVTTITATTGVSPVIANGAAVPVALAWNFLVNVRWTWGAAYARASVAAVIGAAIALMTSVSVFAAGYVGTVPVTAPQGSFPTVLTSATITAGTPLDLVSGAVDVHVPADALPAGTQVTVFAGNQALLQAVLPSGWTYVDGYAVGWLTPNNTTPDATAPLTFTTSDPRITQGDASYSTTSTGVTSTNASIVAGKATFNFSSDPGLIIASAAAPPSTPVTGGGEPVSPLAVGTLAAAGALIAFSVLLRRRAAA